MTTPARPLRVLFKGATMYILVNIVYALINPAVTLSAYNSAFAGRSRFPFAGQNISYSVMIDDVDAMLASHRVSAKKEADEFRIVAIGDSSVWQEGVAAPDTFLEYLNAQNIKCGEKRAVFYNLGYPHPSVVKDLVIMREALNAEPDLIVWFMTLNTILPRRVNPFIDANRSQTLAILDAYELSLAGEDELRAERQGLWDKSLIGKRSLLARWIKLQALGLIWQATELDYHDDGAQDLPPENDLSDTISFMGMQPDTTISETLLLHAVQAGHTLAGETHILLVNEPIFIANGENSEIRYNKSYPRWAYDQYRAALADEARMNEWDYLDLWDAVPARYFSTILHLTEDGGWLAADALTPTISELYCQ